MEQANFIVDLERLTLQKQLGLMQTPNQQSQSLLSESSGISNHILENATYIDEFWTSKQRQAHSLHEVSYRACFKPQLPRFFIENLTQEGNIIYDPFLGRGTTLIESALLNRNIIGNDINPLSQILCSPRLSIPDLHDLEDYLATIPFDQTMSSEIDLSMFYHEQTLGELVSLKNFLLEKEAQGTLNPLDHWIRMVATNRLTGHSQGFFSVYTLPPNQAVSQERQLKINEKYQQAPQYRDVKKLILKKTKSLIKDLTLDQKQQLQQISQSALFLTEDASQTKQIPDRIVDLTVTSPPFLNVVQYSSDNWLRCWFNGIDAQEVSQKITMSSTLQDWQENMQAVFYELYRVTKHGGYVAFEVGEVCNGQIKLDEIVAPLGSNAGFCILGTLINEQKFTKTSNIWKVNNNQQGTNTNRIVIFKKEAK